MIVKAIANKKNRDITIDKLYPVILKTDNEIRIVDDFSGLSIYDIQDFEIYRKNINSYNKSFGSLVYKLVDYTSFLEDYYNDDKDAAKDLINSQLNIFKEDLISDELVELITSKKYSSDEKIIFVEALDNTINEYSLKVLVKYFQGMYEVEQELLLSVCKVLSEYQNKEVYDLFLMYISDDTISNNSLKKILIDYFNKYN